MLDLANQSAKEKDIYVEKILTLKSSSLKNSVYDYTFYDEMVKFIYTKDKNLAKENIATGLDTFRANMCVYSHIAFTSIDIFLKPQPFKVSIIKANSLKKTCSSVF